MRHLPDNCLNHCTSGNYPVGGAFKNHHNHRCDVILVTVMRFLKPWMNLCDWWEQLEYFIFLLKHWKKFYIIFYSAIIHLLILLCYLVRLRNTAVARRIIDNHWFCSRILAAIRLLFSQQTRDALEIYGTNKNVWQPVVYRYDNRGTIEVPMS